MSITRYLSRVIIAIGVVLGLWIGAARLADIVLRGTALEPLMIPIAVAGLVFGVGLAFEIWPSRGA